MSQTKAQTKAQPQYKYGIWIFRKDLRVCDNRGLNNLHSQCEKIIPIFIFTPEQVELNETTNNYLSFPALRFLSESVIDLKKSLNPNSDLYIFYGSPSHIIKQLVKSIIQIKNIHPDYICVGFNADFSQFALKRDKQIIDVCTSLKTHTLITDDDQTLCSMELLVRDGCTPYKQYGAFRKNMLDHKTQFNKLMPDLTKSKKFIGKNFCDWKQFSEASIRKLWEPYLNNYFPLEIGQRVRALSTLSRLNDFRDYGTKRDILSYETTHLSAYLNFGLISEREFYWALVDKLGTGTQLINQIIWRDYYLCLLRYLPKANSYDLHIDERYDQLKWVTTDSIPSTKPEFDLWREKSRAWKEWKLMMDSKTGFLLVDAAIQELKTTGFMHNRCRMIVGVFCTKYLQINPLCRYIGLNDWFSRHLLDCSTSQNKLNAQWVTELDFPGKKFSPSTSPIAGRPMNISNQMIKKWDPECLYVKKWLPHLSNIDVKQLYKWDTAYNEDYHPKPIFDPRTRYNEWIVMCKSKKIDN